MQKVTNTSIPAVTMYQTDAYGGGDDDVGATEKFTHASGESIDLLSDFNTEDSGISAAGIVKFIEAGGATGTDNFVINLYRRHNNSWTGNELPLRTTTVTNPGVASGDQEQPYEIGIASTDGPGHYRIGLKSAGSTNTFDVEVVMVICGLISQHS